MQSYCERRKEKRKVLEGWGLMYPAKWMRGLFIIDLIIRIYAIINEWIIICGLIFLLA